MVKLVYYKEGHSYQVPENNRPMLFAAAYVNVIFTAPDDLSVNNAVITCLKIR